MSALLPDAVANSGDNCNTGIVVDAIGPGTDGRVACAGTYWNATTQSSALLPVGAIVKVTGKVGANLIVEEQQHSAFPSYVFESASTTALPGAKFGETSQENQSGYQPVNVISRTETAENNSEVVELLEVISAVDARIVEYQAKSKELRVETRVLLHSLEKVVAEL